MYDPASGTLWVSTGSDSVSVISAATNQVVGTVPVGIDPLEPALDELTDNVYVPDLGPGTLTGNLTVVSATTDRVVTHVSVGYAPATPTFDSSNNDLYVTFYPYSPDCCGAPSSTNVTVVSGSTNAVIATVRANGAVTDAVYDPQNDSIFALEPTLNSVIEVSGSTNSIVATLDIGFAPTGMTYDSDNGYLYVAGLSTNGTVVATIAGASDTLVSTVTIYPKLYGPEYSVAALPGEPTYDAVDRTVYVPLQEKSCTTNFFPTGGFTCPAEGTNSSLVAVSTSANRVLGVIPVGWNPSRAAYEAGTGDLVVSNEASCNVSVVNASSDSVATSIPTGRGPSSPIYATNSGEFYVSVGGSANVLALSIGSSYPPEHASGCPAPSGPNLLLWGLAIGVPLLAVVIGVVVINSRRVRPLPPHP